MVESWNPAMIIKRSIISFLILSMILPNIAHAAETNDVSTERKYRPYIQTGVFVGTERSNLHSYNISHYRLFYELGLKVVRPSASVEHLHSMLVGLSIAGGIGSGSSPLDIRFGVGPTVVWDLSKNWRLHNMAGLAWSNKSDIFGLGFQLRNYIAYKNTVSFDILFQTLQPDSEYERSGGTWVSSLYGGVVFHGRVGAYVTLATIIAAVVFVIVALASWEGWETN
jgi:hypothetical protein